MAGDFTSSGFFEKKKKQNDKPGTIKPPKHNKKSAMIYQLHPNISTGSSLFKSWSNPRQSLQKSMVLTPKIWGFPVDSPWNRFWERSHPPSLLSGLKLFILGRVQTT